MYKIFFTTSSIKELEDLPSVEVKKIYNKIESLKNNPFPAGSKKLKGKAAFG